MLTNIQLCLFIALDASLMVSASVQSFSVTSTKIARMALMKRAAQVHAILSRIHADGRTPILGIEWIGYVIRVLPLQMEQGRRPIIQPTPHGVNLFFECLMIWFYHLSTAIMISNQPAVIMSIIIVNH